VVTHYHRLGNCGFNSDILFEHYLDLDTKSRFIMTFAPLVIFAILFSIFTQRRIHKADLPKEFLKLDFNLWLFWMILIVGLMIFTFNIE
jgi:hypothetical protein